MNAPTRFTAASSSAEQIRDHLVRCDPAFSPPLSSRVDIGEYARKLRDKSCTFEAWAGESLVGLVAMYIDQQAGSAYISNVSVEPRHGGSGIGSRLLANAIDFARGRQVVQISLQVSRQAAPALALYASHGFNASGGDGANLEMRLEMGGSR